MTLRYHKTITVRSSLRALPALLGSALLLAACGSDSSSGADKDPTTGSTGGTDGSTGGTDGSAGGTDGSTGGTGANTGGTVGAGGSSDRGTSLVPGTEAYDCSAPSGTMPSLELMPYASGLNNPVTLAHPPGDTQRLFVVEQAGVIRILKDGAVSTTPFLDIQSQVTLETWEQGLLGLAFHPDYDENGLFYVHYNSEDVSGHTDGSGIISEFRVSAGDPDVADPASERIVIAAETSTGYHNGGTITFGPDGMLYIALGDGGSEPNGQDETNIRAGISRIDPLESGGQPYTVPAGNLSESLPGAAPELWSYGLRNPYRTNFDACTGALYIGDVGQRAWEEVNVEPMGKGHRNYGWPILEGEECYLEDNCDPSGLQPPVHVYPNNEAGGPQFQAVIGGAVYRGTSIPALRGSYFFSDLYGNTRSFVYDPATETIGSVTSHEEELNPASEDQGLVAIENGGDGELYFISRGGSGMGQTATGAVYRLQGAD